MVKPYIEGTIGDEADSRVDRPAGVAEDASRNIQEGVNLPSLSSSLCNHYQSHC
jgi:hypothetical protein